MGYPMVPKITIAVRSNAARGTRRVPLPSNAAAGGVPALRQRDLLRVVPLDTPELLLRPRARPRTTTGAAPIRRAVARSRRMELPLRAAAAPAGVQGARPIKSATAQVHRSGASPGRAQRAAWTFSINAGTKSPATPLSSHRMPRTLRASSRGHNKNPFSSPCRCCAQGRSCAPSLPDSATPPPLIHSEFSVDNSACRKTSCVASSARSGG